MFLMKRVLVVLFAAVLLLGACGSDDGDVLSGASGNGDGGEQGEPQGEPDGDDPGGSEDLDEDERAAAARVSSSLENDPDAPDITPDQADCVGARVVEELGVERVEEIDWEGDEVDLPEEDGRGVARAIVECVDVRPLLVEGMVSEGAVTGEQAECLSRDLTDDELVEVLTAAFVDGDGTEVDAALYEPLADAMLNCMDFGALLVEQFAAGGQLSQDSAQCLADAISEDLLRELIIAGMTGGETSAAEASLTREVMSAAPDCLTDEELSGLGG
jgi:hypothetical protein